MFKFLLWTSLTPLAHISLAFIRLVLAPANQNKQVNDAYLLWVENQQNNHINLPSKTKQYLSILSILKLFKLS